MSRHIQQCKAFKRCNQIGVYQMEQKLITSTKSYIYKTIDMMGLETSIITYDPLRNNHIVR